MWLCFTADVLLGFLWCNSSEQQIKKHYVLRCDDLCNRSLTLVYPEPRCGGRDLEAAVIRALDIARFPVQYQNMKTVIKKSCQVLLKAETKF